MSKQYLSVPVKYEITNELKADDIKIPVSILVMHDQINLNQSNFDFEVIDDEDTKESIKNIPILGYIKKIDGSDSKDFSGHEMEVTFKDGDLKVTYLERPIGVIPETNNYEYVEKDGKKYVKVIGYLWKDYLNDGYDVLQENPNKSVSMEIVVDSYEVRKDGIVDIKAYRYIGITVLGDNVTPAMEGANMEIIGQFSQNQNFSKEFYKRVEKLNFELKNKPSFKISSYFIQKDKAEQLVNKVNSIFSQLGFECLEYIVDGKEYQITGIINKTINEEATKYWGFDIYDKDTITINSLDFETLDTASISISSVELLMNKNNNTNQQHFTLKIKENNKEGGTDLVDEKLELLKKYNLTIEQLDFNLEEIKIEDLEEKLIDFSNNQKSNAQITFSATYRQKREALANALEPKIERDEDGNITYEEYMWVEDFDDEHVFVEKSIWTDKNHDCKYGRFTYTFDEDSLTATISGEFEEMVLVWLTIDENQKLQDDRNSFEALKTKISEFELTITTLNTEIETLKTSNDELLNYKNNNELNIHTDKVNEVFSDFEESLKENEKYIALKSAVEEDIMNFSVDDLKKDLLAILGELNFSKTNKKAKPEKIVAPVINSKSEETVKPRYGKYEQYMIKSE